MKDLKTTGNNSLNSRHTSIIAEIGTSHNGSLERAKELIYEAAAAGADCVKTQIVFADEIIHPNTGNVELPGGSIRLYDRFLELEQDFNFYKTMKDITEAAGLVFLASPFGFKSLNWLIELGCDTIKIASPELNHFPLLEKAAASGKKLILSTGVSKLTDIEAALAVTGTGKTRLMHCITSYPAPEEEYNLQVISSLSKTFSIGCGVSDHSRNPLMVPAAAAAIGACCIEKHFTLKNSDGGLDDPIALEPSEFTSMVKLIREIEKTEGPLEMLSIKFGKSHIKALLGDGIKRLAPSEASNYGRTNRSVHALYALSAGDTVTLKNTALLRTEKKLRPGLRPEFYNEILGKKLVRPVDSGQGITREDL